MGGLQLRNRKALLARRPEKVVARYLKEGEVLSLAADTITDPGRRRAEWTQVAASGHAPDREASATRLFCRAVPLATPA